MALVAEPRIRRAWDHTPEDGLDSLFLGTPFQFTAGHRGDR